MSTDLMTRARALISANTSTMAALAVLPLASIAQCVAAAPISTHEMSLDSMYVGYWNASGFFTQPVSTDADGRSLLLAPVPELAGIGGSTLDEGLKLYGDATMSDAVLGRIGTNFSSNAVYGLAFAWVGTLIKPLQVGDNLALHYDFSLAYSGEASVSWVLRTGFLQSSGSAYVPGLYASTGSRFISFDTASGHLADPGIHHLSGRITGADLQESAFPVSEFDAPAPTQWAVVLTTDWADDDRFRTLKSGDSLTVTVPQNSIDIGLNRVPGTTVPPVGVPAPTALVLLLSGLLCGRWRHRR